MTPKTAPARRDRQLKRASVAEWGFSLVFFVLLALVLYRPTDFPLYAAAGAFGILGSLVVSLFRYRALDERGRLRFLKSWTVGGMVAGTALLTFTILVAYVYVQMPRVSIGAWLGTAALSASVILSALATVLTNLYLRWKEGA